MRASFACASVATAIFAIASLSSALADWQVARTQSLGTLSGGADVREVEVLGNGIPSRLIAILFSEKTHTLRVVDSPVPGTTRLATMLADAGILAGVNGSYFHEDYRPLGLVIARGQKLHEQERAKLLSGIVATRKSQIAIVRSQAFRPGPDVRDALQAGPMLVEFAKPVAGLNATRAARRTLIATDGRGRWALMILTSLTLSDTASLLATPGILEGFRVTTALNLDGGSSTGLWAATTPRATSFQEINPVRNSLGIVPR